MVDEIGGGTKSIRRAVRDNTARLANRTSANGREPSHTTSHHGDVEIFPSQTTASCSTLVLFARRTDACPSPSESPRTRKGSWNGYPSTWREHDRIT